MRVLRTRPTLALLAGDRVTALGTGWLGRPVARQVAKVTLDFLCGATAVLLAAVLHGGWADLVAFGTALLAVAVGALLAAAQAAAGSYRTLWRYTGLHEALASCGAALVVLVALGWARSAGLAATWSHESLVLATLLALFGGVGVRGLRRWQVALVRRHRGLAPGAAPPARRRVLIVGAGERGLSIGREIAEHGAGGVQLVGYLDDNPAKIGRLLHGVPVLGPLADLFAVAERHRVGEVIVAMPHTDAERVRAFVRKAEDAGLRVRAVRTIEQVVAGRDLNRPGSATLHELLGAPAPGAHRGGPRVLVTGGAGFIGSHLVRLLLEGGYRVRVLDRFDYGRAGLESVRSHPRLEITPGDICNSRDLSRAARDVDSVVALAAVVGDPACNLYPEETINLNYTATKILVETCNFYGVRRLIFASSCSVYGASANGDWLTERSRLRPLSLYARTRVLSENILFDRCGDVEPVVLRLATVFGLSPRMRFDLVVNTLTARAAIDHSIVIHGGNQWRPNVHCRDVARACLLALAAPSAAVAGEVFNVGADALNHTIAELGELVGKVVGRVDIVRHNDVADPRNYRVSFAKIRTTLGFEPEYTVAQGIEEVDAAVRAIPALRRYEHPIYHNVQAFHQSVVAPRRRRDDALWPDDAVRTRALVPA